MRRYEPEKDDGNREYKLKLSPKTQIEHIATQMRYRIEEGHGEAFYTIGVMDNGDMVGLTEQEYLETIDVLNTAAKQHSYSMTLISSQKVDNDKKIYEYLLREINQTHYVDLRIACAGNVDSGKSSLLGVLLTGQNDDGRGTARLHVFNYPHEVKTGRTSSVAQHIFGYDSIGRPIHTIDSFGRKRTWPEIVSASNKIITFFDLCGHEKYLKTTILGLTSQHPDVVFILVGGNMGISRMSREHIFLCLSLHLPFVIIVTKIDICQDRKQVLDETVKDIKQLIKSPSVRRIPYEIRNSDDVVVSAKNIHSLTTIPIFYVSNVSGYGIELLYQFLNLTQKRTTFNKDENKLEMYVDQTFQVSGVGTVIGGQLLIGKIKLGDKLIIGPNNNSYSQIQIKSIHCKRIPVEEIESGSYVCLGIKKTEDLDIRRGQVIMSVLDRPIQVRVFQADLMVLKTHSTTIRVGYQPVVHIASIRQTAEILAITNKSCARQGDSDEFLRTGDRATVVFRFCYKPEYVKVGSRILLVEGKLRLFGKIISVEEEVVKIN